MGKRGGETRDTERQSLTLLPPPEWCVPHRTPSNGEGGWALWRPQGTRRQDRRPPGRRPVPEPTAERGARAAMVGQGTREAKADQGIRDAMAVQSAWAAMADPGSREAMAVQSAWAAMAVQSA